MELKEMIKPRLFDFLLIQAGIALAMGVIGCLKPPQDVYSLYALCVRFLLYAPWLCYLFLKRVKHKGNVGKNGH